LLKLGFIRPSRSPMSSGVVCVVKPDKSIRLACDYRYLNSHTIGDNFPMPNLTEVMHRVGKARWITVCDATSGYWQLDVKEEDRWLTAFLPTTAFGSGHECRLALNVPKIRLYAMFKKACDRSDSLAIRT